MTSLSLTLRVMLNSMISEKWKALERMPGFILFTIVEHLVECTSKPNETSDHSYPCIDFVQSFPLLVRFGSSPNNKATTNN